MAFRKSKWIPGTHGDQPVSDAARSALRLRLDSVSHFLPLAALAPEEDLEYVHQLRVSTRRAAAALETFRALLPKDERKWIARRLREARKAAGLARDLDVLEQRLVAACGDNGSTGLHALVDLVRRERAAAQPALYRAHKRLRNRKFPRRARALAREARYRKKGDEPGLGAFAREALRAAVAGAFDPVRGGFADAESLHRFRIDVKGLRYAMELFAGAFPQDFRREVYRQVAELQQHLGDVNDHHATGATYEVWRSAASGALGVALDLELERERQAMQAARASFDMWWAAHGSDLERAILRYLDGGPSSTTAERATA